MDRGRTMNTPNRWLAGIALLLVISAVGSTTGCVQQAAQSAATAAQDASPSASFGSSYETTAEPDAMGVLRRLYKPEVAGDTGFDLLGSEHNDDAAWTKTAVLETTDYERFVSSVATQQAGVEPAAVQAFRRMIVSRGATATYDAVLDSQWRMQDGSRTKANKQLASLIPASAVLGLLLNREGRLLDQYVLRQASVDGDVLNASYIRPGKADVKLSFQVTRSPQGTLRLIEWLNYREFREALRGDVAAEGLP